MFLNLPLLLVRSCHSRCPERDWADDFEISHQGVGDLPIKTKMSVPLGWMVFPLSTRHAVQLASVTSGRLIAKCHSPPLAIAGNEAKD